MFPSSPFDFSCLLPLRTPILLSPLFLLPPPLSPPFLSWQYSISGSSGAAPTSRFAPSNDKMRKQSSTSGHSGAAPYKLFLSVRQQKGRQYSTSGSSGAAPTSRFGPSDNKMADSTALQGPRVQPLQAVSVRPTTKWQTIQHFRALGCSSYKPFLFSLKRKPKTGQSS